MWPIIFVANDQFCLYYSMRSGLSKCTNPPFATSESGRVYFELLGFRDISGRRLKPKDIGAMSQFCLKITAKNSTVCDKWAKISDELWGTLGHQDWLKCFVNLSVHVDYHHESISCIPVLCKLIGRGSPRLLIARRSSS